MLVWYVHIIFCKNSGHPNFIFTESPITKSYFNGYNNNSSLGATVSSLKVDLLFLILILLVRCWSFLFTICSSKLHEKYIRNLSWFAFSSIRTQYKDLQGKFRYLTQKRENVDQVQKLRIWTPFTKWYWCFPFFWVLWCKRQWLKFPVII